MFPLDEGGVLRTSRLVLRPVRPSDEDDIFRLFTWEVVRWLARPPWPYRREDAREWLAKKDAPWDAEGDDATLGVTLDGAYIGTVGLHPASLTPRDNDGPELGYWIGEPYQGHGYVTEAARAMIARAFTRYGVINSGALAENERSRRSLERMGFVARDEHEIFSVPHQKNVPHVNYELTRARWRELKGEVS